MIDNDNARVVGGVSMIDNAHRAARPVYCPFARSSSLNVKIRSKSN